MTNGRIAARGWAGILAGLFCAVAGASEARVPCVPGSINPGGCLSIRPQDQPVDRLDLVLPPEIDRPLDALERRLEAVPGVPEARVGRVRPDGSLERGRLRGVIPRPPGARDPLPYAPAPSLESYQLPYADD